MVIINIIFKFEKKDESKTNVSECETITQNWQKFPNKKQGQPNSKVGGTRVTNIFDLILKLLSLNPIALHMSAMWDAHPIGRLVSRA
jgi:hypothetical protein